MLFLCHVVECMLSWSELSGGPVSNAVPQCVVSLQAGDHIHANEVILTFGMSNTTLLFLKEAAKKRNFQVGFQTATSHGQHATTACARGCGRRAILSGTQDHHTLAKFHGTLLCSSI